MLKLFINKNKFLILGSLISLLIIVAYEFTSSCKEWFPHANFIFYIIQIYIPDYKKRKRINKCIATPISRTVSDIKTIIKFLSEKVYGDSKSIYDLTQNEFTYMCININPYDDAPMVFTNGTNANIWEYIKYHIDRIDGFINQVLKYNSLLDDELIEILDDILYSKFTEIYVSCYNLYKNKSIITPNIDFLKDYIKEFFDLSLKLSDYIKTNSLGSEIKQL